MNNRDFRPRQQSSNQNQNPNNQNFKSAIKNSVRRKVDRKPKNMRRPMRPFNNQRQEIPPIGENIRIIPLGGVEEIGKNMTAIEIGNDIIIIDAGFQFKDETTPGIDYIIPNTKYLEERKDKIRGMFITEVFLIL
jgi:predicted metal-dependent RNase